MSVEVHTKYRWSLDHFLTSHKYHRYQRMRLVYRRLYIVVCVLGLGIAIWALVNNGFSLLYSTYGALWLYLLCFHWPIYRWWLSRKYDRRPDKGIEIESVFTDTGIESKYEGGEGRTEWTMLAKWIETPEGFLIYPNESVFVWMPFSAFEKDKDIESLRELARTRVSINKMVR